MRTMHRLGYPNKETCPACGRESVAYLTVKEELERIIAWSEYCGGGNPKDLERYVIRHGREYESAALTAEEHAFVSKAMQDVLEPTLFKAWAGKPFERGDCFINSQRLMCTAPVGFTYVEGFAKSLGVQYHAWVTLNGKVIDVTWTHLANPGNPASGMVPILGEFIFPGGYFGVEFSFRDWVRQHWYGALLYRGHPTPLVMSGRAPSEAGEAEAQTPASRGRRRRQRP